MTTNSCYYSTNTDPLVNRRVAEGASSAGRAADEGGVVTVVACTHSAYCWIQFPKSWKTNCCRRLHTRSLEETPMAIRGVSLLDMDFSKEFPFEFAVQSYGCTKLNVMYTNDTDSVKLCLASVLWLHQVLEHSPVSSAAPTAPSLQWREGRTRRFGHLVQQACRHPEAIQDHQQRAGEGLRGWPRWDHHRPLIRQHERRRPEHVGGTSESSLHNLRSQGRIRMLRHVQADLGHEGVSASRNRRVHGQPQRHDQACQEGLDVVLYLFISTFIIWVFHALAYVS